jgi:hypothetical protein
VPPLSDAAEAAGTDVTGAGRAGAGSGMLNTAGCASGGTANGTGGGTLLRPLIPLAGAIAVASAKVAPAAAPATAGTPGPSFTPIRSYSQRSGFGAHQL